MLKPNAYLRIILLIGCLTGALGAAAQDLYDLGHSRSYAAHLMRSRQFGLASEEYERLLFIQPANDTFRIQILRAYRLGGSVERGMNKWQSWQPSPLVLGTSPAVNNEYSHLLLTARRYPDARLLADRTGALAPDRARRVLLYSDLLTQDWTSARTSLDTWPTDAPLSYKPLISNIIERGERLPHKHPALAAGLSTVVPGLGKVYTGDWKDGAIGFLFVGLNAWQSYRRFDKQGIRSPFGWIHGGFALGFYLGNIYGSHKAARMYNHRYRDQLQYDTEQLLYPTLD
jgi:hypothetical protein